MTRRVGRSRFVPIATIAFAFLSAGLGVVVGAFYMFSGAYGVFIGAATIVASLVGKEQASVVFDIAAATLEAARNGRKDRA